MEAHRAWRQAQSFAVSLMSPSRPTSEKVRCVPQDAGKIRKSHYLGKRRQLCEQGRSACLMLCKQAVSFPNIYLPL